MKKKRFFVSVVADSSDHRYGWNNGSRIPDDVIVEFLRGSKT